MEDRSQFIIIYLKDSPAGAVEVTMNASGKDGVIVSVKRPHIQGHVLLDAHDIETLAELAKRAGVK